ncbi:hypothetical protein SLS53_005747 [Cytospora paraplurivora]|uniref:Uncharacterized protein n=1 Tax=Cytospora paraplurivora TaxID=2898453 RepID=A0AAN9UC51_9PEZI
MPRGVKRRREIDCNGNGCDQSDCPSCKDDPTVMNFTPGGDRDNLWRTQPSLLLTARREAQSRAQDPTASRNRGRVPASLPSAAASPSAPSFRAPVSERAPPQAATASVTPDLTPTEMIDGLDPKVLKDTVIYLASRDSRVAEAIKVAYELQPRHVPIPQETHREQTQRPMRPAIPLSQMQPVVDFDRYSKSAWHALNNSATLGLGGRGLSEEAEEVYDRIRGLVNTIDEKTKEDSPLRTKQSAIETLRKIAKSIILSEDIIGHEMREQLETDSHIADVIVRVLESMTSVERLMTGNKTDAKGSLSDKVEWVRDQAVGYCLEGLYGLDRALEMMKTGSSSLPLAEGSSYAPIDLTS